MVRFASLVLVASLLLLASCFGGGKSSGNPQVNAINVGTDTPAAGSLVQVTADVTGTGASSAQKSWSVTSGSLSVTPPDFGLILRGTAKVGSAATLNTTASTVYWLAPLGGGSATLSVTVGDSTKTKTVTLGTSPISINIADSGANKVITVQASNVSDLYQAAFRVSYGSAWHPKTVTQGDLLGAAADTVFFEMHNQDGFVPVAVSRTGNAGGVDGSGTLATITFEPTGGASAVRGTSAIPFDLDFVVLRNSKDEPISF
jgi:hypothetical protein